MIDQFRSLSISYKEVEIDDRGLLSISENQCIELLQYIKNTYDIAELIVISTCNRTEIFYSSSVDLSEEIFPSIFVSKGELVPKAEEEEKALRPPPVKKQFVMLASDPDGILEKKDMVGWIAQIPEDDSVATTASRIHSAAYEYNATPKGTRMPVETVGEACEVVSAKLFKEQNIWVKSKTPLLIVPVENKIPIEKAD